jgi:hypothetical protein
MATKADDRKRAEDEQFLRIYGDQPYGDDGFGAFVHVTGIAGVLWACHYYVGGSGPDDSVFASVLKAMDFPLAILRWPSTIVAGLMAVGLVVAWLQELTTKRVDEEPAATAPPSEFIGRNGAAQLLEVAVARSE